ncbi:MAG: 4-oxalocrotonate tautomerase family protein [bacterium]|nr:4-oxalocrotonate tautomerase family protein [bacterium]
MCNSGRRRNITPGCPGIQLICHIFLLCFESVRFLFWLFLVPFYLNLRGKSRQFPAIPIHRLQRSYPMPFVTVKMLDGRTAEQKRELVKAITEVMVNTCGAKPDSTMVVIEEIARDHWSRGGVLISER